MKNRAEGWDRCTLRRCGLNLQPLTALSRRTPPCPSPSHPPNTTPPLDDAVEAVVPFIPVVIPVVGGIMIFLLAMIAVNMA